MQRRAFLKTTVGAAGAAAVFSIGGRARAAEFSLRVADSYPTTHSSSINTKAWIERVVELTEGRVQLDYYPAEQLAKAADMLDACQNGIADVVYAAPLYISDRLPLSTVAALPLIGNVTSRAGLDKAWHELLLGTLNELEYEPQGVRVIRSSTTPAYQLMMRKDKVITLDQLKGRKIRSSGGVQEKSVERLGAIPTAIPAPDLYAAIQRGTVDGALFNLPTASGYRLEEQLMWSTDNLNLGLFPTTNVINQDVWDKLPEDIQKALVQAGEETIVLQWPQDDKRQAEFGAALEKRGGGLYQVPDEEKKAWVEALAPVRKDWEANLSKLGKPAEMVAAKWEELTTA